MERCPRETLERRNCPRKLPLSAHPQEKPSLQRTSSTTVIPFRGLANELSMTARNYGNDIPELWEGQDETTTMTLRNYPLEARIFIAFLASCLQITPTRPPRPLAEFLFTTIIK